MTSHGSEEDLARWVGSLFPDQPNIARDFNDARREAPERISRAYQELLSGYSVCRASVIKPTLLLDETTEYEGIVTAESIPFISICAHHFLPFVGWIAMAYQPGKMIVGIGKLPRLVDMRARRLQIQESLVQNLCHDLMEGVGARGAFVQATAQHLCICGRGPNKPTVTNSTVYAMGTLKGFTRLPR